MRISIKPTLTRIILFLVFFLVIPVPITVLSADNGEGIVAANVWGSIIVTPYVLFITPLTYLILFLISYALAVLLTSKFHDDKKTCKEETEPKKQPKKTFKKKSR